MKTLFDSLMTENRKLKCEVMAWQLVSATLFIFLLIGGIICTSIH